MTLEESRTLSVSSSERGRRLLDDPTARQCLAQMFGESLVGPWPALDNIAVEAPRTRKRKASRLLFWAIVASASALVAFWLIIGPGLSRRENENRAHYVRELESFLENGELARVAEYAHLVDEALDLDRRDDARAKAQRDLVTLADAMLYRYYDADQARANRVRTRAQATAEPSPLLLMATLTVASRHERASRWADLKRLEQALPNHYETQHLLATALEVRRDRRAARAAWLRANQLGPAWLSHRFEHAQFEALFGGIREAQQTTAEMLRINPDSPWSQLSHAVFVASVLPSRSRAQADASVPQISAVVQFYGRLEESMVFARRNNNEAAGAMLEQAVDAVHGEAPFLLDAFEWLVLGKFSVQANKLKQLAPISFPTENVPTVTREGITATGTVAPQHASADEPSKPTAPSKAAKHSAPSRQKQVPKARP